MIFLPQTPPAQVAPKAVFEAPFTLEGYLIVVEGKVNGQPAKLLLDTGAGAGLYTPKSAAALKLKITGEALVAGGGEKSVPAKLTSARIEIGGAVQDNQLGVILELPTGAKTQFDGIVGYPFLKNYVVQLDYASRRVRFLSPKSFVPDASAEQLPMTVRSNIPEIPGSIDGLQGSLRVDTGYAGALTFTAPTVAKNELATKYSKSVETVLGKGVGGVSVGRVTRIAALELGALRIPGVLTGLSEDKSGALSDTQTIALLGGEVLSRFTVTLDYPGKRLFLRKNADFDKPFLFGRAGISGSIEAEGYTILTVLEGSPAARLGIHKGDVLLSLDGAPVKTLGLSGVRESFRRAVGTSVKATLRTREGIKREVTLVLEELL